MRWSAISVWSASWPPCRCVGCTRARVLPTLREAPSVAARLAAWSALSFPSTPSWPGTQAREIDRFCAVRASAARCAAYRQILTRPGPKCRSRLIAACESMRTVTGPRSPIRLANSKARQAPVSSASNTSFPFPSGISRVCHSARGFCHAIPAPVCPLSSRDPSVHSRVRVPWPSPLEVPRRLAGL